MVTKLMTLKECRTECRTEFKEQDHVGIKFVFCVEKLQDVSTAGPR